jgi:hypothetical protein
MNLRKAITRMRVLASLALLIVGIVLVVAIAWFFIRGIASSFGV